MGRWPYEGVAEDLGAAYILRGMLASAEARAWCREADRRKQPDTEPGPRCEMGVRTLLSFGAFVFIGSGGRAFKQHVVPCVNPTLERYGNGATSELKAPLGGGGGV